MNKKIIIGDYEMYNCEICEAHTNCQPLKLSNVHHAVLCIEHVNEYDVFALSNETLKELDIGYFEYKIKMENREYVTEEAEDVAALIKHHFATVHKIASKWIKERRVQYQKDSPEY